jgi:hypothetical protein
MRTSFNSLTALSIVLIVSPLAHGNAEGTADRLLRRMETKSAAALAVTIVYGGELVFTNGDSKETFDYAGGWATKPGQKASALVEWDMHLTGLKITEAKPTAFYGPPPKNMFIGPITRAGFYVVALSHFLQEHRVDEVDGPTETVRSPSLACREEQVQSARRQAASYWFMLKGVQDDEVNELREER